MYKRYSNSWTLLCSVLCICIYIYSYVVYYIHIHIYKYIRAHVLVEATTVLERGGFGAGRVCISWFSRPTTLAPRVASRRLHHTVEHYITENDEPRVQSPGTLASLMCVMPLPRGECTAPATIYIPRNSRNRSHFVVPLSIRARSASPLLVRTDLTHVFVYVCVRESW